MTLFYRLAHGAAHLFFRLYGRVEIIGHERIPRQGPVIVASNHVSYLDPPLVGSSIRRECAFLAQDGLWKKRWFGRMIAALNSIPVNREHPDRASFRRVLEALERGLVLVLFPEGTRSPDGSLRAGAPGVALFIHRSGAPVVPTVVVGPEKMLPPGQSRLKRAKLKVVFGDPLFFTPDTPRDEVVAAIMRAIAVLLAQHRTGSAQACEPIP